MAAAMLLVVLQTAVSLSVPAEVAVAAIVGAASFLVVLRLLDPVVLREAIGVALDAAPMPGAISSRLSRLGAEPERRHE
jgi:hypothetical protein